MPLRSFTANPVPLRYKTDTLFHELLHKFLAPHSSEKFAAAQSATPTEPDRTRGHLHLLALGRPLSASTLSRIRGRGADRQRCRAATTNGGNRPAGQVSLYIDGSV